MSITLPIIIACGFAGAAVPANGAPTDLAQLRGSWKVVSASTGNPDTEKHFVGDMVQFRDDVIRVVNQSTLKETFSFTLNENATPKQIDLHGRGGRGAAPLLGIYAIEGDRLKLSWSKTDGRNRPTSFALPPGRHRQVTLELQRVVEK